MSDVPPSGARPPRSLRGLVRILGSGVILGLLLWIVPFGELRLALGRVGAATWLGALAAYLSLHLVGILKWRMVMNGAGAGISVTSTARCYYYGLFGNIFLPSIVGGDVIRAGLAAQLSRSTSGVVLGSLVDRMIDFLALAAVAGIGLLLLPSAIDPQSRATFLAVIGVMAIGGGGLLAVLTFVPWMRRLPYRFRRRLVTPRRAFRSLRGQPERLVASLVFGIALQGALALLNAWLGGIVGVELSPLVWLFVWPLAKLAAVLPVTQGGIGVREGALVALLQPFGVASAPAMAAGLVFTSVVMAGGLVGGGAALLLGRSANRDSASGSTSLPVGL